MTREHAPSPFKSTNPRYSTVQSRTSNLHPGLEQPSPFAAVQSSPQSLKHLPNVLLQHLRHPHLRPKSPLHLLHPRPRSRLPRRQPRWRCTSPPPYLPLTPNPQQSTMLTHHDSRSPPPRPSPSPSTSPTSSPSNASPHTPPPSFPWTSLPPSPPASSMP